MTEADPFDASDDEVTSRMPTKEDVAKIERHLLEARRGAYCRVMAGVASPDDLKIFMDDLRWFCLGGRTAWADDARVHALLTGRQEVWLRIQHFTTLSLDELVNIYTTTNVEKK